MHANNCYSLRNKVIDSSIKKFHRAHSGLQLQDHIRVFARQLSVVLYHLIFLAEGTENHADNEGPIRVLTRYNDETDKIAIANELDSFAMAILSVISHLYGIMV